MGKKTIENHIALKGIETEKFRLFKKPFMHIILISLLGFLAYSNTFNVPFQFDDSSDIVGNPAIQNLKFFTEPSTAKDLKNRFEGRFLRSRYIGYLTFALNYKFHGLDVEGYHIFNLAIHILNAILVYWLVTLTLRTTVSVTSDSASKDKLTLKTDTNHCSLIALFSALLFVSHPIQTQAVTYIVQRLASLATMFYLLSLVMYIKFRLQAIGNSPEVIGNRTIVYRLSPFAYYLLSLISAVLAMKTKEIAFTLPATITLYEFMFFNASRVARHALRIRKRILYLIPFALIMSIVFFTLMTIDNPAGKPMGNIGEVTRGDTGLSRLEYLTTEFRVMATYIRLILLPINQNLDYDYPVYHSFLNPDVLLSFLLLLSIFGPGIYLFYRSRVHNNPPSSPLNLRGEQRGVNSRAMSYQRLIAFGIFWFFLTLLPESSVIPLSNVIYEHRVYLSSVGIIIAACGIFFVVIERPEHRQKKIRNTTIAAAIVMFVLMTAATYSRNSVWKDEVGLLKDVINKSPRLAKEYNNLGISYQSRGLFDNAVEQYLIALKLDPNYSMAYNNLGVVFASYGLIDSAMEQYRTAIRLDPVNPVPHNNLGNAYLQKNLFDMAIEQYLISIRLDPYSDISHFNLGRIYFFEKGEMEKARREFEITLQLNPQHYESRRLLEFITSSMIEKKR